MAVSLSEIISLCNKYFPPSWAAPWDHVGLQLGDPNQKIQRILVTLEINKEVIREIEAKKIQLVITHHTPWFKETDRINTGSPSGRIIWDLARSGCALLTAHTNFDACAYSMTKTMGELLELQNLKPLLPRPQAGDVKVVTFVPLEAVEKVRSAMASAGAGIIGEYSECSFALQGKGSFRGSSDSNPTLGEKENLETVDEIRLEMVTPKNKLGKGHQFPLGISSL